MAKGRTFRGGITEMMKQAHRIQTKLELVKKELKEETPQVTEDRSEIFFS